MMKSFYIRRMDLVLRGEMLCTVARTEVLEFEVSGDNKRI